MEETFLDDEATIHDLPWLDDAGTESNAQGDNVIEKTETITEPSGDNADGTENEEDPAGASESDADADSDVSEAEQAEKTFEAELKELGFPDLPEELANDPAIAKRYLETQAGISKLLRQEKEKLETIDTQFASLAPVLSLAEGLMKPETARGAADNVRAFLQDTVGYDPFGAKDESQDALGEPNAEFIYESDRLVYERAKADAIAEMKREFGQDLEALRGQRQRDEEARREAEWVDKNAMRVIGYLSKADGWGVTKEMVREAVVNLPQFKDKPEIAVKKWFAEEYAKHKAEQAAKTYAKRGPEMAKSGESRPSARPDWIDPDDMTIHDIHL